MYLIMIGTLLELDHVLSENRMYMNGSGKELYINFVQGMRFSTFYQTYTLLITSV